MQHNFPTSHLQRAVVSLAAGLLVVGVYFFHERILEPLLGLPKEHPGPDIFVLIFLTVGLSWLGSWLYAHVQLRTLEGLRDVLTHAGVGIVMLDRSGRILWFNPAITQLFGLEREPWVGRQALEYLEKIGAGEAAAKLREGLARLAVGQAIQGEAEVPRVDGRRVAASYALSPLRGRHNQLLGALIVVMDITERKRMAEELRASRDNLQRLIEAIPAGVTVVEAASGRPVLWNEAARRMAGVPVEVGLSATEAQHFLFDGERRMFDPQGHELLPADLPLQRTLRTHEGLSEQHLEIELEDGRRLDVAASTAFLETPAGGQAVLIFQDISGIQRLQQELVAQRVQAEKLQAMLATVATLNHEINNPLTGILGCADLLLDRTGLDEIARRHAGRIRDLALRISEQVRSMNAATRFEQRREKGFEEYLKVDPKSE